MSKQQEVMTSACKWQERVGRCVVRTVSTWSDEQGMVLWCLDRGPQPIRHTTIWSGLWRDEDECTDSTDALQRQSR